MAYSAPIGDRSFRRYGKRFRSERATTAAREGGVAVSGLEMSQNWAGISWKEEELQNVMKGIHDRRVQYGDMGAVTTSPV